MPPPQRYVSPELSHFVGSKSKSDEQQYDILVNKILKPGQLTYPPHDPTLPRTAKLDLSKPISTDDLIKYQVVCFCDIPESELAIHVRKYGKFGLAFRKEFLVGKGASPVFYIANEAPVPATEVFCPDDFRDRVEEARKLGPLNKALYFDTSARGLFDLLAALDAIFCKEDERYIKGISADECKKRLAVLMGLTNEQIASAEAIVKGNSQSAKTIKMCIDFLINGVFTNMKCFNATKSFHDSDNYYMEREWRIGDNVKFDLDDVIRVFLPSSYAKRFRMELPTYTGQLSFVD